MFGCILDQADDARHGAFAVGLGDARRYHAADVDASRQELVVGADVARQAFAGEGYGVERCGADGDDGIERHFLAGTDDDGFADGNLVGADGQFFAVADYGGGVGLQLEEVLDALAAASLGDAFKELADLEEEHHEDGFGELRLGTGQEPYAERADGGDGHQEMLVEGLAVQDAFGGLLEGVEAHDEIGYKID